MQTYNLNKEFKVFLSFWFTYQNGQISNCHIKFRYNYERQSKVKLNTWTFYISTTHLHKQSEQNHHCFVNLLEVFIVNTFHFQQKRNIFS